MIKNNRGFTIVEMVVSVAIIGVMVTIITIGFRGVQSAPRSFNLAIQEFSSIMELAQDYAKASYNCCNDDIIYGYGIFYDLDADTGEYLLFADKNGDYIYNGIATDAVIENLNLSNNVTFYPPLGGARSIVFPISPGPVYLDGVENSGDIRIDFEYENGHRYKYLFLNGLTSRISVDENVYDTPQ